MEVMLIIGFLLFVVTLVGHAIWSFVAFVFRSLTEPSWPVLPVAPIAPSKRTCPHCGASCAETFQNCPTCGQPVAEQPRSPAAQLQSLQRQLDLLLAEDVLSLEQFESARVILQQAADKLTPEKRSQSRQRLGADAGDSPRSGERGYEAESVRDDVPSSGELGDDARAIRDDLPSSAVFGDEAQPKRSTWTDWLQAFLEDKNIRWGELLAGMLIVGSSVGLVISLWSTLRNAIPYFPALCFLAVTAAIHGAGLYTLRHWRLKTTSRGLLTIALLLVPLNFLAAIALSEQRPATDPLYLTAVVIGVAAYGWITWSGARELMHFGASWLSLSVLGSAIGQLVIGRRTTAGLSTIELSGLFALPLVTYVVALLSTSHFAARWRRLPPRRVESLYRLLGIAFFSLVVALSLLLWKSQAVLDTLSRLSPSVSLAGAMIVGYAGQLLPRSQRSHVRQNVGGTRSDDPRSGERGYDIAAASVTLIGAMLMVAAVVLAWPDPERLIAVGVVNFLALSWFGFAISLAPLHVPALASLALAGLMAFHRFGQAIGGAGVSEARNLIETILLGRSGMVLALMSLLTAFVARCLATGERGGVSPMPLTLSGMALATGDSESTLCGELPAASALPLTRASLGYFIAAAGMAVLSLGIAGYAGFWPQVVQPSIDRSLPTLVFVLFGIAGMAANERLNRIELAWTGTVVWLAVFLHGLGWNTHVREWLDGLGLLSSRPIVVALLSFATWSLGCAIIGQYRNRFVTPWSTASGRAVVVALLALPWKVWGDFGPHAIYLGWVAALCLGQAHLWQSRKLFSLSQALAFLAAALGLASFAERQDWWMAHANEFAAFLDVRHGHWQMTGLALACVPWVLWRRFGGRWGVLARGCVWKLDRVVLPIVVIASAVTIWFSVWPFVGFEQFQRPELWPVVKQPWIARGWDRVLLWLIGWGAVTWSQEEVCRRWFRNRRSRDRASSDPIRFPWMAALGTLVVGVVLFVVPQFVWSGVALERRQPIVVARMLLGPSMWWVCGAGLLASGLALLERGRWPVRVLFVACWVAMLTAVMLDVPASVSFLQSGNLFHRFWSGRFAGQLFDWLTLIGVALLIGGSCSAAIRRRLAVGATKRRGQFLMDDAWGVAGFLCLLPVIVLAPQLVLAGALSDTVLALLFWTALLVWRARGTRSAAVAFGASHAWCCVFAMFALVSNEDFDLRNMLPSSEVSFAKFLVWSAIALGTFSWLWTCWRDHWGPLEPAWWDWRGESSTITPWLWQQYWSWSCLLLSSGFAASVILRRSASVEVPWPLIGERVGFVACVLVAGSSWLASTSWRHRCHTLGLASLAWVPMLATYWVPVDRTLLWRSDAWNSYHVWEVGWVTLAVVWSAARCVLASGAALAPRLSVESTGGLTPNGTRFVSGKALAAGNSPENIAPVPPVASAIPLKVSAMWSDVASLGVVLLAVREMWFHQPETWPASCVAVVAASATALALANRSQWRVAASIACVVLATAMQWTNHWQKTWPPSERQFVEWLQVCIAALGFGACFWQWVEVGWQTKSGTRFDKQPPVATAHGAARLALVAALSVAIGVLILNDVTLAGRGRRFGWTLSGSSGWVMTLSIALPFAMSWWDRFAKVTIPGMYGWLWLALLLVFDSRQLRFADHRLTWVLGLIAVDVALVGAAWWLAKVSLSPTENQEPRPSGSGSLDDSMTIPLPDGRGSSWSNSRGSRWSQTLGASWRNRLTDAERWISNSQLVWATVVSVLAIIGVLTFDERSRRLWCVASAAVLVPGIAAMARSRRRELFQRVALGLGAVCLVDVLWALMEPHLRADFWLQRSIRALEALAVTAFVYGVGLVRVIRSDSDWRSAVQRAARDAAVLAIVALLTVLALEAWWFDPVNGAPVTGLQIALVAAALVGLAVALLAMALTNGELESSLVSGTALAAGRFAQPPGASAIPQPPGASALPLSLTPQALVYAAEVVVALLFLHCYLTMPELFRGYLQPYWPLIVMAIAFAGVGASELCQRAKLNVLSEPLQNSAALLPLIPALGFWVATSRTDYSSVLFAGGLVYVWLNLRRRSFWYVLAAALAGNAGLWSLWSEQGVELLVRPQLWLIPPALSVLAAAQWNRRRLTQAQLAAIRYPAITLLYVSSAGEMFLTGIAESFWLPIVLMLLSVLGVLAGIWLRVRAFLYLGASFLLLSLVSMVWHAAEAIDHTWPWWAFGIGLGLGVLTLFGLFERKRNEMLRLLGELRTWER